MAAAPSNALTFAEIMSRGGGDVSITRAGYEFLLRDTAVQLWTFLRAYLASAGSRGTRPVDALSFLLELGFCEAGAGYAVAALSDTQRALLEDFASLGLVHVPPSGGDDVHVAVGEDAEKHAEIEVLAAAQSAGANIGERLFFSVCSS